MKRTGARPAEKLVRSRWRSQGADRRLDDREQQAVSRPPARGEQGRAVPHASRAGVQPARVRRVPAAPRRRLRVGARGAGAARDHLARRCRRSPAAVSPRSTAVNERRQRVETRQRVEHPVQGVEQGAGPGHATRLAPTGGVRRARLARPRGTDALTGVGP